MSVASRVHRHLVECRKRADEAYGRRVAGTYKLIYQLAKFGRPVTRRTNALRSIGAALRKYGRAVRETSGVSLTQQLVQQYEGVVRCHLSPKDYYLYTVYNDSARMGEYIAQKDWWQLLDWLLTAQDTGERTVLDDKRKGERHFLRQGLPAIRTFAVFEDGDIQPVQWDGFSPLPGQDLFSKPAEASYGRGARRWLFQRDGRYRAESGETVSLDELLDTLALQSEVEPVLLQPRIANHRQLRMLSGDTLASLRIITMRWPEESAQYLIGCISLPLGDVVGSNARFGVLRASIEASTGRLGAAYDRNDIARIMEPVPVHPMTGERIAGFQLPDWDAAVDLALQAHNTLPTIALVAWDIAITPDGPVIIEGNSTPGANSPQITHKMPWGATDFPECYMANWEYATRSPRARSPRSPAPQ